MANEIKLAVVAKDNATSTLRSVKNEATGLGGALNGLSGPMDTLRRNWQPIALAAGAATAAIGGAIFTAKQFVDVAAATDEALNKNRVIFKENAAEIQQWADDASTSFGLSQRAALDASGTFGNMFTQLGINTEQALGMSTAMTELAADFASFHNADITEVIQAQTAAFRGEYDALQRYVPTINAAAVEQEALKMGLAETSKALTAQDKALATNALIMQGAGEAAGDFDRTADSLTNQSRILQAQLDDLKGEIGRALIPAFTDATAALNGFLDEHSEDIANGIASGIDAIAAALGNVSEMVAAIRASGPIRLVFDISEKSRSTIPGVSNAPSFRDFALGTADDNPLAGANWLDLLLHPFQGPGSLPGGDARREWDDFIKSGGWSNSDLEALGGGRPFTPGASGIDFSSPLTPEQQREAARFGRATDDLTRQIDLGAVRDRMQREAADAADAMGGSMRKLADELTEAEKQILEVRNETLEQALQIQNDFMHEQIAAYLKGGKAQVEVVKEQQQELFKSARKTAEDIMKTFGVDLPTALSIAMDHLSEKAADLKRQTAQLNMERFSVTEQLIAKGVSVEDAIRLGREALPDLPSFDVGGIVPGPRGAPMHAIVHGGETIIPNGASAGAQIVIHVTAPVGADLAAAGMQVAQALNQAATMNGQIVMNGVVQS